MRAFAYVEEARPQDLCSGTIQFVLRYSRKDVPQNFCCSDKISFDKRLEEVMEDGERVVTHRLPLLLSHHDTYIDDNCPGCPVYKIVTRVPYDEYMQDGRMPDPLVIPPLSQRV